MLQSIQMVRPYPIAVMVHPLGDELPVSHLGSLPGGAHAFTRHGEVIKTHGNNTQLPDSARRGGSGFSHHPLRHRESRGVVRDGPHGDPYGDED